MNQEHKQEEIYDHIRFNVREEKENTESEHEEKEHVYISRPYLSLKSGTSKYIIMLNGCPFGYANNIDDARKYMWKIARARRDDTMIKWVPNSFENFYIREQNTPNELELVVCVKGFFSTYEHVLHRFSVYGVQELIDPGCETTRPTGVNVECKFSMSINGQ